MKNSKGRKKKKKVKRRGKKKKKKKAMFPPGIEPGTLRVWGARDNRYTTETSIFASAHIIGFMLFSLLSAHWEIW